MSRTYRRHDHATRSSGGRRYPQPRYQPGSRQRPHRLVATPQRRNPPDLDKLARAIARAALGQPGDAPDATRRGYGDV